jgi:hypothetical protein
MRTEHQSDSSEGRVNNPQEETPSCICANHGSGSQAKQGWMDQNHRLSLKRDSQGLLVATKSY